MAGVCLPDSSVDHHVTVDAVDALRGYLAGEVVEAGKRILLGCHGIGCDVTVHVIGGGGGECVVHPTFHRTAATESEVALCNEYEAGDAAVLRCGGGVHRSRQRRVGSYLVVYRADSEVLAVDAVNTISSERFSASTSPVSWSAK